MNDPIVDEVRRIRGAHAAQFNYDLDAIFRDIKEHEKMSGYKFVTFPPRRTEANQAHQSTESAALSGSHDSDPSKAHPVA